MSRTSSLRQPPVTCLSAVVAWCRSAAEERWLDHTGAAVDRTSGTATATMWPKLQCVGLAGSLVRSKIIGATITFKVAIAHMPASRSTQRTAPRIKAMQTHDLPPGSVTMPMPPRFPASCQLQGMFGWHQRLHRRVTPGHCSCACGSPVGCARTTGASQRYAQRYGSGPRSERKALKEARWHLKVYRKVCHVSSRSSRKAIR